MLSGACCALLALGPFRAWAADGTVTVAPLLAPDFKMALSALRSLRAVTKGVPRVTTGIPTHILERFDDDADLKTAIASASTRLDTLRKAYGDEYLFRPELELCSEMQSGFVNFYDVESLMPFVPVAAKGPWVVTLHGAVVHDNGGYGMLGFGHNADFLTEAVGAEAVMANLLMPSFSQVCLCVCVCVCVCVAAWPVVCGACILTARNRRQSVWSATITPPWRDVRGVRSRDGTRRRRHAARRYAGSSRRCFGHRPVCLGGRRASRPAHPATGHTRVGERCQRRCWPHGGAGCRGIRGQSHRGVQHTQL